MSKPITVVLHLDEAEETALNEVAQETGRAPDDVVDDAVRAYLLQKREREAERARYVAAVREGVAQVQAGKVNDFDVVMDRITAKLERMKSERDS